MMTSRRVRATLLVALLLSLVFVVGSLSRVEVSAQNGLSALRRQQILRSPPPGFRLARIARIAGTGAAKNWVPMREKA